MNLKDYSYHLPEQNIAQFPLKERSASKLLVYRQGQIEHSQFKEIPFHLPDNTLLVFNNTKVIPARIFFTKSTGALIEVFLLEPIHPFQQRELAMEAKSGVKWKCMIRNLKKWKGETLTVEYFVNEQLHARLVSKEEQLVEFTWNAVDKTFAEVIEIAGRIPLPPYMHREATEEDLQTYQTVYAAQKGAVAAPTAGLHFTEKVLEELSSRSIKIDYLTLHVSAGTFQPIKAENVSEHDMHEEEIIVSRENLQNVIKHHGPILPVGTTSMRTLESTFWFGVKLLNKLNDNFDIEKDSPYKEWPVLPSRKEAFQAVLRHLEENQMNNIIGRTSIFIYPGYKFRVSDGLITNFHLPGSTLILLVAALVGNDWRKIYEEALDKNYRFLSYGDSSLLLP